MIRHLVVGADAAGFPVVRWTESRSFSPPSKIECRIMKDKDGVLLFVARGHVRLGQFEEGRPWEMLDGIAVTKAADLYQSSLEQAFERQVANRSPAIAAVIRDSGRVLLARFKVGAPIHLNCADASLAEVERLQAILIESFRHGSHLGLATGCRCAPDDPRIESYDPARSGWTDEAPTRASAARGWATLGLTAAAIGLWGLMAGLVALLAGMAWH